MEGGFLRESDSLSARCLLIEVSCSFVCHFASLQLDFILPPSTTIFPQIQPLHSTDIAYLLDVVVGKSTAVLKLLSSKDQALLVRWDSLLVLDLALDVVDGVGRLHLEGDSLARQGLYENLHRRCGCRDVVVVVGKRKSSP